MFDSKKKLTPIWEKENITLLEAVEYFGIGRKRLRTLSMKKGCNFALWYGDRMLFKRKKLEEYLDKCFSI